jgi:hypothetical protein
MTTFLTTAAYTALVSAGLGLGDSHQRAAALLVALVVLARLAVRRLGRGRRSAPAAPVLPAVVPAGVAAAARPRPTG